MALYARFSTNRQDARSIDDQLRRCQAYASLRDWRVVGTYADLHVSGSHMERGEVQRLLSDARRRGGAPFQFVLVDDLSRLSRDVGDMWRVVFGDLASANVAVVDVSSGVVSTDDVSEMQFGAQALLGTMLRKHVRRQTHRGLEGRALGGFCTGGRTFGYASVQETNPPDPLHPRKVRVIQEEQAVTVRRIFTEYANGSGYAAIAASLNADGVPAPYDATRRPVPRHGWAGSTIRAMLFNRAYIGELIWNRRQFSNRPGQRARKARKRPVAEHRTTTRPELAIVSRELWDAVHSRLGRRAGGRPSGTGSRTYLLSGLLSCATCGGNMSVIGASVRDGRRYPQFGCSARKNKGRSVCSNGMTISEDKLNKMVLGALSDALLAPGCIDRFVARFNARVAAAQEGNAVEEARAQALKAVLDQEERVRRLTDAVVQAGWSDALGVRLKQEEARLAALRQDVPAAGETAGVRIVPHPAKIETYLRDLMGTLYSTPERGRQLLAKHLGKITLTPQVVGGRRYYEATSNFDLSVTLAGDREARVRDNYGCGDRI
ncbi:MAG: recombinase family protein [Deltaproteobacteria bacterium]|nr:recombinase family protein [Deltaproteobacteria bacterium]